MPLPQCGTKPATANLTPDSPGGGRTGRCPIASTSSSADLKAKPPARAFLHTPLPPRAADAATRPMRSLPAPMRRMARSTAASTARSTTLRTSRPRHWLPGRPNFVIPGRSKERSDARRPVPLHRSAHQRCRILDCSTLRIGHGMDSRVKPENDERAGDRRSLQRYRATFASSSRTSSGSMSS